MEKLKNIQLKEIRKDSIILEVEPDYGNPDDTPYEVEIIGIAQSIIIRLGLSLNKESFRKLENQIKYN